MKFHSLLDRAKYFNKSRLIIESHSGSTIEITYSNLVNQAVNLSKKLEAIGVVPGHLIGIQAGDCLEWILWDLATLHINAVLIAFPEEMNISDTDAVVQEYGLALFVNGSKFKTFNQPHVIDLLIARPEMTSKCVNSNAARINDDDVFSRVFSSGSTGHLKGLNISKKGTELLVGRFIEDFHLNSSDKALIFLPLSNYQQRMIVYGNLWVGADTEFVHFTKIFQSLKSAKPTYVVAPPSFYDNLFRLYKPHLDKGNKLRNGLGGNIRFMITGMAPIRRIVIETFNQANIELVEAYGVTETGMIAWNTPQHNEIGTVGKLIWPNDVIIDETGNITINRKYPLTLGYFHDPCHEEKNVFLPDGRIVTGDIGDINSRGRLTLKGRIKDIILTSGGQKFHPTELEVTILDIENVKAAVVLQSHKTAEIIVIVCVESEEEDDLSKIQNEISEVNKNRESFKKINRIVFTSELFTRENGCITRNMKISRSGVYRRFFSEIERLEESSLSNA